MAFYDSYKHTEDTHQGGISGDYRVVIVNAEEAESKSSGKGMFVITLRPSGAKFTVRHYIVEGEYFNEKMSRFFDAFPSIGEGNFNPTSWIGADGAAHFGPDKNGYSEVKWFIAANKATKLPPFEGEKPEKQTVTTLDELEDADVEVPF